MPEQKGRKAGTLNNKSIILKPIIKQRKSMKVVCVHTAMALVGPLTETFKRLIPEVEVEHIAETLIST